MDFRDSLQEMKRSVSEADHPSPSSAEGMNKWIYTCPPLHNFMALTGKPFALHFLTTTKFSDPKSRFQHVFTAVMSIVLHAFAWSLKASISFVMSVCISVCFHVSVLQLMENVQLNLLLRNFMKIYQETPDLINIRPKKNNPPFCIKS